MAIHKKAYWMVWGNVSHKMVCEPNNSIHCQTYQSKLHLHNFHCISDEPQGRYALAKLCNPHCKNKIVKITKLLVNTFARNNGNCNYVSC